MERIEEAQSQLCELNEEEPLIAAGEMSKAELVYIFDKLVPFFVNGQAATNSQGRHITGKYHRAKADLENKRTLTNCLQSFDER